MCYTSCFDLGLLVTCFAAMYLAADLFALHETETFVFVRDFSIMFGCKFSMALLPLLGGV